MARINLTWECILRAYSNFLLRVYENWEELFHVPSSAVIALNQDRRLKTKAISPLKKISWTELYYREENMAGKKKKYVETLQ